VRKQDLFANVAGLRLHYLVAGESDPMLLLQGYAENSNMWRPDLRGFGQSCKPMTGYKKPMVQDIHALVQALGYHCEIVVGHDIGLIVAYSHAVQYPDEVDAGPNRRESIGKFLLEQAQMVDATLEESSIKPQDIG